VIDSDDVTAMRSACKPRAPAAQNGKLPSLPPLHLPLSLSLCLSAYFSLYLLSHLSFLNTPTLLLFFSLSHPPLVLPHRQHASARKENLSRHRYNNKAEFCFVWFCSTQQSKYSKRTNLQVYCTTVKKKKKIKPGRINPHRLKHTKTIKKKLLCTEH